MIKLNDEYSVDITANSYNLVRYDGISKDGKERWIATGYYANLYQAVRACIEKMTKRKLMERDCDLAEALRIMDQQKLYLKEMLGKVGLTDER